MLSKLSSYQLKIECYIFCKPHDNHKGKPCSRYTKEDNAIKESKHTTTKTHQNKGTHKERKQGSTTVRK